MYQLTFDELQAIDGGKLETFSDWCLMGASICFAFCAPAVGVPAAILCALW